MSYFDDASLVMIPSGYKTSKVYSVKPTDGTGDLTFTRSNDTATRVNSAGLIEKVRTNLILQSQAFNTTWTSVSASVTANTTANPLNGAVDADTITLTGATTQKYVTQAFSLNGNYTASVYLKAGTHQFAQIMLGTDTAPIANFDLTNGTSSATNSTARIVSVGGGWYRCSMSFTSTTGTTVFILAVDSLAATRFSTTASTGTLIAFGYQLETGDIATDYIATTSAAVSVGPVANVPRLDYLGSSCPRLLLEPQRVNLVNYSEQMTLWANGAASVTANATTSPDGYTNADRINNTADVSTFVSAANGVYTFSLFVKQGTSATASIDMSDGATGDVITTFTFATKTFSGTSAGGSWTSPSTAYQDYGNGWYRISLTATKGAGSTIGHKIIASGTGTTFVWGAQLELGSYVSSYVNTLGAAVTRGADAASKTSASALIGQTEGTLFAEVDVINGTDNFGIWMRQSGSLYDNIILISFNSSRASRAEVITSAVQQVNITGPVVSAGFHKIALAYKANDFALYVDGVQAGTDTSGSVPTCNEIYIDQYIDGGVRNATKKQVLLFKTRLSNADLAALTA